MTRGIELKKKHFKPYTAEDRNDMISISLCYLKTYKTYIITPSQNYLPVVIVNALSPMEIIQITYS